MAAPNAALAMVLGPEADQGSRRKIHIAIDKQRLEIRAVEITSNSIGDAPVLSDFVKHISLQEEITFMTTEGAYDPRARYDATAARGAVAVNPARNNPRLWKPITEGA